MTININVREDKYIIGSLLTLLVILVSMILGGTTGQIVFSFGTIAFFGLYVLIGTQSSAKQHSLKPFVSLVAGLVAILGIGFALLWYFHLQNPGYSDPAYWLGFPRATAVVVYVLWMPPALYLMFAYPYLFETYIWNEKKAQTFREMNAKPTAEVVDGGDSESEN